VRTVSFLLTVLLLTGCASAPQPEPEAVSEVKLVELSGEAGFDVWVTYEFVPLPGAEVTLTSTTGTSIISGATDIDGRAHFNLPPGEWSFNIGLEGLVAVSGEAHIPRDRRLLAMANLALKDVGEAMIACPPPLWYLNRPGRYTLYNVGRAWPVPWWVPPPN